MAGEEKSEVYLQGGVVKVGERFCFPCVDQHCSRSARIEKDMIDGMGNGPFVLLGVKYYPRDGHPFYMLHFVNSKGEDAEVTRDYFVKYKEQDTEPLIVPCEDGCAECGEDEVEYRGLINGLSAMHIGCSTDPKVLVSAQIKDFDRNHPDFSKYPVMQGDLFEIADRHRHPWTQ